MNNNPDNTDVEEALDLLAAEVRDEILRIREEGADAMKKGDYATAKSVIEFAGSLEQFAGNVEKLVAQWHAISKQHDVEPEPVKTIVGKIFFDKARKGTITTDKEMEIPLLRALVILGGRVKTKDAVDQVGKLMEGKLKPKDFELLKSGTDTVRWRNKVMWARNNLVNESGLMKCDSPFGIWEISDKGRELLSRLSAERSLLPVTPSPAPVPKPPAPLPVYIPERPRFPATRPDIDNDTPMVSSAPKSYFHPSGGTKGPQSNISVVMRWDIIGKGQPERLRAATAAATLVQTILRLSKVLGPETLERLAQLRISRGPLLSRNPARDFMNKTSMETYQNHLIPGTDLYVFTNTSTDEKVKHLNEIVRFLRMPASFIEVTKHLK
jgi:hypothetical protein